jgi:hypothetical protein
MTTDRPDQDVLKPEPRDHERWKTSPRDYYDRFRGGDSATNRALEDAVNEMFGQYEGFFRFLGDAAVKGGYSREREALMEELEIVAGFAAWQLLVNQAEQGETR